MESIRSSIYLKTTIMSMKFVSIGYRGCKIHFHDHICTVWTVNTANKIQLILYYLENNYSLFDFLSERSCRLRLTHCCFWYSSDTRRLCAWCEPAHRPQRLSLTSVCTPTPCWRVLCELGLTPLKTLRRNLSYFSSVQWSVKVTN